MNAQRLKSIAVGLGAVGGLLLWVWLRQTPGNPQPAVVRPSSESGATQTPTAPRFPAVTEPRLQAAVDDLRRARSADERNHVLARLREALATGATNEIAAAIRRLLDSKADASTGLGFKIGANGTLLEAPTLRTMLLNQLAQLDPGAAAAYARVILASSNSSDEWAVALRSLARGDSSPEARALLEAKTGELLRNESWQQVPSVGYLEAFDAAVYLGGTNLLSPLSDLVRQKDNPAVAHAAFLTLDRLVINQTAEALSALAQHPEWMTGREETRANYFARADVSDELQRRLVETYLLDPSHGSLELQTFAGIFPNANFMISQNLLTANTTLDSASLARRDQASLARVNEWLTDPRFEKLRPALLKMRDRLTEFTRQTGKAN